MCWPKTYRPPGFQGFKKTRLKLTQDQYKFQSKVRNSVSQVSTEDWLWHMQHHWWKQWFHEQQWHWQLQVHISVRTLHSFLHTAIHCHCGWLVSWLRTLWILQCFLVPLSLTYFPWLTELNNSIGLSSFCWWTCTTIQVHRRKIWILWLILQLEIQCLRNELNNSIGLSSFCWWTFMKERQNYTNQMTQMTSNFEGQPLKTRPA